MLFILSLSTNLLAQSRIEFDSTICHLGQFKKRTPIEFRFEFKNNGKMPIKIINTEEVGAVGYCEYSKKDIAPGKQSYILWHHQTFSQIGKQQKTLNISFTDTVVLLNMYFEIIPKIVD